MKRFLSVLLAGVMTLACSTTALAEDGYYVVQTTKTTTTMVNGVVVDVKTETYNGPVQYGSYPTQTYTAPAYTAPAQTAPTYVAPATKPVTTNYDYGYATLGDEAKKRAAEIAQYASDKGLGTSTSGDWGDCNYRRISITIAGHKVEQLTQVSGSTYLTTWEYNGSSYSKDGIKEMIKYWAGGGGGSSGSSARSQQVSYVAPSSSTTRVSSSGALYKEATNKANDLKAKANNNHWSTTAVESVSESDTLAQKRFYISNKYGSHTIEVITETQWAGGYYTTVRIDGGVYSVDGAIDWIRSNRD